VEPRRFAAKPRPKQKVRPCAPSVRATCIASASSLTAATPRTRPTYPPRGARCGDAAWIPIEEIRIRDRRDRIAQRGQPRAVREARHVRRSRPKVEPRDGRRKARLGSRVLARHSRLGHPRASALAELEVALGGELRVRINDHAPRDLELRARSRVDGMRAPALSDPSRIARRSCSSICAPSFPGPSQVTEWADWSRRLGENWILKVTQRAVASAQ
jgi:hypothetical protein